MNDSETYKVYQYTFPNGMIYIGMTKRSIQKRRDCGYQHNNRLKNAIRTYGWRDVETTILADSLSQEAACEAEKAFIEERKANHSSVGYNISIGGKQTFLGLKHTEKHKRHMSEVLKGKIVSDESKRRMREAHKKERRPVMGIDDEGNTFPFESLRAAAVFIGGYGSNIARACSNHKKYKGLMWEDLKGGDLG